MGTETKKWQPQDVAAAPLRCMGPRRTIEESIEWLQIERRKREMVIEAAMKRLEGKPLTPGEARRAPEGVTTAQVEAWGRELGRLDRLIAAIKARPTQVSLRGLASDFGLPALVKGIRNKGCGADLRDVLAEMLNDGTLKEDGVEVAYTCPACKAPHEVFRTPPKEASAAAEA